ncbi:hypothetical protein H9Q69_002885 [Fusarium xylarioides]|nr:hypothetical protein H9Q69_002885 [Fusarium xylarioides]
MSDGGDYEPSDDYDSSDDEFLPPPDKYAHVGKESIEGIFSNAKENRRNSKRLYSQLQPELKTQTATYNFHLWGKRFEAFVKSLGVKSGDTPTEAHLCRFIAVFPTTPRAPPDEGKKYSISTIRAAIPSVIKWCQVNYPDWKMTPAGDMKLQAVMNNLVDTDKISTAPANQKQWVTTQNVRQLVSNYLQTGVQLGLAYWDKAVLNVICMVILAATGARPGDVAKSFKYTREYCLRWEHIVIARSSQTNRLIMTLTIHYAKGKKTDPSGVIHHEFNELTDASDSPLCLIKWLIVWALRTGVVRATSWAELKQHIDVNPGHVVEWILPNRPVLCCGNRGGVTRLDFDKPLQAEHMMSKISQICALTPTAPKIVPYDFRRGAAFEVANLASESQSAGVSAGEAAAALLLGHSARSVTDGVTRKYIGNFGRDEWTARVKAANTHERAGQRLMIFENPANTPAPRPKRLTPEDVTEACKRAKVDPSDINRRNVVKQRMRAQQRNDVRDAALNSARATLSSKSTISAAVHSTVTPTVNPAFSPAFNPTFSTAFNPAFSMAFKPAFPASPAFNPTFNPTVYSAFNPAVSSTFKSTIHSTFNPVVNPAVNPDGTDLVVDPALYPDDDLEEDPVVKPAANPWFHPAFNQFSPAFNPAFNLAFNPAFAFDTNYNPAFNAAVNPEGMGLAGNSAVHSDLTHQDGENIASDKVTGLGEESVSNETCHENSQAASVGIASQAPLVLESVATPWLAEADVFVEYFARVNVYHYSGTRNAALPYYFVSGGSRDPPTRFFMRCKNHPVCDFATPNKTSLETHHQRCMAPLNGGMQPWSRPRKAASDTLPHRTQDVNIPL